MWLITSISVKSNGVGIKQLMEEGYSIYSDEFLPKEENSQNRWFIEGDIFPRINESADFISLRSKKLLDVLFAKYGDDFIHRIKGNFIVIQINKNGFKVFSDYFGIKKIFFWQHDKEFIITNDLKEISKLVKLKPSAESMAIYALTYHFSGGTTLFENVKHNTPGQVIEFKDGQLCFSNYWKPEQLLNLPKRDISIKDISEILTNVVSDSIRGLKEDSISLSLTGGADTRNLLAIFLKLGVIPHLYTYGNPKSNDCLKSNDIAKGLNLLHCIYDIQMDEDAFEKYARYIIRAGNGLASIHRAHRIMAVEGEAIYAKTMFLGTLGGEYIKGVSEDDYIIPAIVYENWRNESLNQNRIAKYLEIKSINNNSFDIDRLLLFLNQEPYLFGDINTRKHNSLSYITAHLHDSQDINLYNTQMKHIFTPFLDIDYLEIVFSSEFTFEVKEKISNKLVRKINYPIYSSKFIRETYPPLLKYKYVGEHIPKEVLFNKYYAAIARLARQKTGREYPQNFPLGYWMDKFVKKNLPLCKDYKVVSDTFNIDKLMNELKNNKHRPTENYWLKFTNPIIMCFIIEGFSN